MKKEIRVSYNHLIEYKDEHKNKIICAGFCIYVIHYDNTKEIFHSFSTNKYPIAKWNNIFLEYYNKRYEDYILKMGIDTVREDPNEIKFINDEINKEKKAFETLKNHEAYKPPLKLEIIEKRVDEYLKLLVIKLKYLGQSKTRKKKTLTYMDIFLLEGYAKQVKEILEQNDYTKNGKWIAEGSNKKLATAYFVLKDDNNGICAIKHGSKAPQLIAFYKEFGLEVKEKGGYTTIRNVTKRPEFEVEKKSDYIEFTKLFQPLKSKNQ